MKNHTRVHIWILETREATFLFDYQIVLHVANPIEYETPEQLFISLLALAHEYQKVKAEKRQAGLKSQQPQSHTDKVASRIAKRIEEKKLDKEISELISDLSINDNNDAMDTSNLVREIATDDNEYTLQLVRKKK